MDSVGTEPDCEYGQVEPKPQNPMEAAKSKNQACGLNFKIFTFFGKSTFSVNQHFGKSTFSVNCLLFEKLISWNIGLTEMS